MALCKSSAGCDDVWICSSGRVGSDGEEYCCNGFSEFFIFEWRWLGDMMVSVWVEYCDGCCGVWVVVQ